MRDTLDRAHKIRTFISPRKASPICSPLTRRLKVPLVLVWIRLLPIPPDPLASSLDNALGVLPAPTTTSSCLKIDRSVFIVYSLFGGGFSNLDCIGFVRVQPKG